MKNKSKLFLAVVALMASAVCFTACGGSSYSGYSSQYQKDSGYRNSVNDFADQFGLSRHDVDKIFSR